MKTTDRLFYSSTKFFTENEEEYRITATVSLDDDCYNNMCDWSITADIRQKTNMDDIRSIWEAAATMRLRSMFQNWRSLYNYIVVIIMVLLCIRWKMVCIT